MPEEMAQDTQVSEETSSESENSYEVSDDQEETQDQISSNNETQEEAEYTEKGTKLDPNPMSRVNQELANERRKIKDYEEILNNPKLLKAYVDQFDTKEDRVEPEEEMLSIEQVETTADLQKFLRQRDGQVQKKLKELDSTISGFKESQKDEAIASNISSDITAIREIYPELNPKSDSYDPELDQAVGELFEMYDFDPKQQRFKGSVSLKKVAQTVMKAAGSSKKRGSQEAQTYVKDRRSGRADGGGKASEAPNESNMTASQIIAQRAKAAKSRMR